MNVDSISLLNKPELQKVSQNSKGSDFGEYLKNALDKVNEVQLDSENATLDLITGKTSDIHQVMLSAEEAKLSLELAVQIRNKLVDAYQEIMRMQL